MLIGRIINLELQKNIYYFQILVNLLLKFSKQVKKNLKIATDITPLQKDSC